DGDPSRAGALGPARFAPPYPLLKGRPLRRARLADPLKILFVGDVVGRPGRTAVQALLPKIRKDHGIDFAIVNGENSAGGAGLTLDIARELMRTERMSLRTATTCGTSGSSSTTSSSCRSRSGPSTSRPAIPDAASS